VTGSAPAAGEGDPLAGTARLLALAAAPTFAAMALVTALSGDAALDLLCAATLHGSRMDGMALMYLLMAAFHLPPWLRLLSGRWSSGRPASSRR